MFVCKIANKLVKMACLCRQLITRHAFARIWSRTSLFNKPAFYHNLLKLQHCHMLQHNRPSSADNSVNCYRSLHCLWCRLVSHSLWGVQRPWFDGASSDLGTFSTLHVVSCVPSYSVNNFIAMSFYLFQNIKTFITYLLDSFYIGSNSIAKYEFVLNPIFLL